MSITKKNTNDSSLSILPLDEVYVSKPKSYNIQNNEFNDLITSNSNLNQKSKTISSSLSPLEEEKLSSKILSPEISSPKISSPEISSLLSPESSLSSTTPKILPTIPIDNLTQSISSNKKSKVSSTNTYDNFNTNIFSTKNYPSLNNTKITSSNSSSSKSISPQMWLIIILIVIVLSVNIMTYLEYIIDFIIKLLSNIGFYTVETTKEITNDVVDEIINVDNKNQNQQNNNIEIDINKNDMNNNNIDIIKSLQDTQQIQEVKVIPPPNYRDDNSKNFDNEREEDILEKVLNDASNSQRYNNNNNYMYDDTLSTSQSTNIKSKPGWCYIGEDRGFRVCSNIGVNDECMSGQIFPTQDICINPSLRL